MATSAVRIRRARTRAKLSQAELAARIGVKRSAAGQWEQENGTRPSMDNLCQIAVVTHVRVEWLATGRGTMKADESHQASALEISEFAQDELEARFLIAIRRVDSERKRMFILEMIEALSR